MTLLKYIAVPTEASWTQHLYHAAVPVENGYVRTDDPLTIEALLYRGFVIVEEEVVEPAPEAPAPRRRSS